MTSHVARLYALALSLVAFFLVWAVVAAHPWAAPKPDPTAAALATREQRVRAEAAQVRQVVDRRWRAYRIALAARQKAIAARKQAIAAQQRALAAAAATAPASSVPFAPAASAPAAASTPAPAAPSVRIVTLPPLTVTRTS